jgi:pimeloyl-ACP methyl ester carboxylesterase
MTATYDAAAVNGIRMHYLRAGSGPLLVLLHGWAQTTHCWRKLIEPLSERYTVVAPHLRSYGRSDKVRRRVDRCDARAP